MKKVIFIDDHSGELHCDNKRCDYVAPRGLHTWGQHLIGLPCPKCGENLLTIEDYRAHSKLRRLINRVNKVCAFFGMGHESLDDLPEGARVREVSVRAHAGKIEIKP